jgi:RNA polymerase sigma-70 factor (ECF subfamily)
MHLERQQRERRLREVFKEEYNNIFYFALKLVRNRDDADNIASKAFVKLWNKGESFKDRVETRKKLYVVARGFALDHLRHEKVIRKGKKGWESTQDFSTGDPASNAQMEAEYLRLIKEMMALLPPVGRETLDDFYLKGKSAKEIAGERGINEDSVYDTKNNALKRLRELLGIRKKKSP